MLLMLSDLTAENLLKIRVVIVSISVLYAGVNCSVIVVYVIGETASLNCCMLNCRQCQSDDDNVMALLRKWRDDGLDDSLEINIG